LLANGGIVKARSFEGKSQKSDIAFASLGYAKTDWKVIDATTANDGGNRAENAVDEHTGTLYSTLSKEDAKFPQQITIDMGTARQD
jgi:alpha-L-fucosidase